MSEAQPPGDTVLDDPQRRLVLLLLLAGFALVLVALLMPPRGPAYWVALVVAPLLGAAVGAALGGAPARRLDRWLVTGGAPATVWEPLVPQDLPTEAQASLRVALLPLMLRELGRADRTLPPHAQGPARALLAAGLALRAQPEADPVAVRALADVLPGLLAGLAAGNPTALHQAEALARELSGGAA